MKIYIKRESEEMGEAEMGLSLEEDSGGVTLTGVDARGKAFIILRIAQSGISRPGGIGINSGWPLDEHGRIKFLP